jgi:hypothetical protein
MPSVIKHVFKYQEQRRTLYLNLAAKDDFGRHRGQVLYGMTCRPSGSNVIVGPGAMYTSYGTKFYWDVVTSESSPPKNVIDISNVKIDTVGVFEATNNDKRPLVVGIIARITPQDPSRQPEIEGEVDITTNSIEFVAEVLCHSRVDSHPTYHLDPLDPVEMDDTQTQVQALGEYIKTWDTEYGISPLKAVLANSPSAESLGVNDILLGYLVIGCNSTGAPATTLEGPGGTWEDGVAYVPCRNAWESLTDFLGTDPLLGRMDVDVVGPSSGNNHAYEQTLATFEVGDGSGGERSTTYRTPKFGTPQVFSASNPWAGDWNEYRLPNFLRDGDSFIWLMRRLDYFLRLWMDRTGDMELISWIQDGTADVELDLMAPLHQILAKFTGLDNSDNATRNLNTLSWPDGVPAPNSESLNHILKSGVAGHVNRGMDVLDKKYGDSHTAAIAALNWAAWNFLTNFFGVGRGGRPGIDRAYMRGETTWDRTSLGDILAHYNDGPLGTLPFVDGTVGARADVNRPVLSGTAITAYLESEPIYDAFSEVAQRASQSGQNLIRNHCFSFGDNASNADGDPLAWAGTSVSSWSRSALIPSLRVHGINIALAVSGKLTQTADVPVALLRDCNLFSAAMNFRMVSGTARFGVRGYNGVAAEVFSAFSQDFSATEWASQGFLFGVSVPEDVVQLTFEIAAVGGACQLEIASTWCGQGTAPANPSLTALPIDFMSTDAGRQSKWRGDQILDNNDVHFGTDYGDDVWSDVELSSLTAGVTQTYSGELSDPRVIDSATLRTLVAALLVRSRSGQSANLLRNPNFQLPGPTVDSGSGAEAPLGYSILGADWSLTKAENRSFVTLENLQAAGYIEQRANRNGGTFLGDPLFNDRILSAHVTLSCTAAVQLKLEIITLNAAGTENGRATATFTTVASRREAISISAIVPSDRGHEVADVIWRLYNDNGAEVDGLNIYAAWLGYGWPPDSAETAQNIDVVDVASANPLVRDLSFWDKKGVLAADPVDPQDVVNLRTMQAADQVVSDYVDSEIAKIKIGTPFMTQGEVTRTVYMPQQYPSYTFYNPATGEEESVIPAGVQINTTYVEDLGEVPVIVPGYTAHNDLLNANIMNGSRYARLSNQGSGDDLTNIQYFTRCAFAEFDPDSPWGTSFALGQGGAFSKANLRYGGSFQAAPRLEYHNLSFVGGLGDNGDNNHPALIFYMGSEDIWLTNVTDLGSGGEVNIRLAAFSLHSSGGGDISGLYRDDAMTVGVADGDVLTFPIDDTWRTVARAIARHTGRVECWAQPEVKFTWINNALYASARIRQYYWKYYSAGANWAFGLGFHATGETRVRPT